MVRTSPADTDTAIDTNIANVQINAMFDNIVNCANESIVPAEKSLTIHGLRFRFVVLFRITSAKCLETFYHAHTHTTISISATI